MKISTKEQLEQYLAELAKVSVEDAFRSTRADSEKKYQSSVDRRVKDTTPSGGRKQETDEDEKPELRGTGGQPIRGEPAEPELDIDDPSSVDGDSDEEFTPDDITVDAIADRLNSIRSGRSMKDSDVLEKMDDYIRSLDDHERVKLYGFLKNINTIVTVDQAAVGGNVKKPDSKKAPEEPEAQKRARVKDLEKRRELKKKSVAADTQSADDALKGKHEEGQRQEPAPQRTQQTKAQPQPQAPSTKAPKAPPSKDGSEDRTPPIRVGTRSKGTSF